MIEQKEQIFVAHTPYKIVGWTCIALFTLGSIMAARASAFGVALFFLLFVGLGIYILLGSGSMTVNAKEIRYNLPLASYKIEWREIKHVEVDRQFSSFVFVGENKRLAVNGVTSWTRKNGQKMLEFLLEQMRQNSIEFKQTEWAMVRTSKNSKTSRNADGSPTSKSTTAKGGGFILFALEGAPSLASLLPHRTNCLATSRFPALFSLAIGHIRGCASRQFRPC